MLSTPVTLFIFNRPDLTEIVLNAVAEVKPKKLFVVADGPDREENEEKCRQSRAVIERVDWDCEVFKDYAEGNVGPKRKVPEGIDWVFSQVEDSIFLEDDVLPDPSFFYFCQDLLEYYRDDERVMHINGGNFLFDQVPIQHSYYFSRYVYTGYGWASWKRAWKHHDQDMKSWNEFKQENAIANTFEDFHEQDFWTQILDRTYSGELVSYDFPWFYTMFIRNGLAITPQHNMVSNLGFRPDATHTKSAFERTYLANIPRHNISEITHPKFALRHRAADRHTFDVYFGDLDKDKKKKPYLMEKADYYWAATKWKLNKLKERMSS